MPRQIAVLFERSGKGHAFAGHVTKTDYDTNTQEIIIRIKKLATHNTLRTAFNNAGVNIHDSLLSLAAESNFESRMLRQRAIIAEDRNNLLRTQIAVLRRQLEVLEDEVTRLSSQP